MHSTFSKNQDNTTKKEGKKVRGFLHKIATITTVGLLLIPTVRAVGNAGGNGGDIYVDEFKAYRDWVVQVLLRDQEMFQEKFGFDSDKYDKAIARLNKVSLVRRDKLGKFADLLPMPVDKLFVIDEEEKSAVNLSINGEDLVIFDISDWDKVEGKFGRKLRLMAHELFGILGLEKTGEATYSIAFLGEQGDLPHVETEGKIPVVPLWSEVFVHKWVVSDEEPCLDSERRQKISDMVGKACYRQLPTGEPAPYFSYECVLNGRLTRVWKKGKKTTTYTSFGRMPGSLRTLSRSRHYSYYYVDSSVLKSIYERSRFFMHEYTPGYDYENRKKIEVPVYSKLCSIRGRAALSGVDPISPNDPQPKLYKSSEGSFDEIFSATFPKPEKEMRDICFSYRKKIRRGLFDQSRCKIFPIENGKWRWELWTVHPYSTNYSWSEGVN